MKKIRIGMLLAAGMLLMAGCGSNDERIIGGEVNNTVTGQTVQEDNTLAGDSQAAEQESGTEVPAQAQVKGYVFEYKGVIISVDAEAAPIVEAIGEDPVYYEAPSCAFEGLDKIYTYASFELDTYPLNDVDYVSAVIFKDDAVATAEGIVIGDSMEKLTDVYGPEYLEEGGMIVYEKDGMRLCFILTNGSISSIQYQRPQ